MRNEWIFSNRFVSSALAALALSWVMAPAGAVAQGNAPDLAIGGSLPATTAVSPFVAAPSDAVATETAAATEAAAGTETAAEEEIVPASATESEEYAVAGAVDAAGAYGDAAPTGGAVEATVEGTYDPSTSEEEYVPTRFFATYFGVLYGPAVKNTSSWQPTPTGKLDTDRPILVRNYVGLGYDITDEISITPTAYFLYRPVMGQEVMMRDPFLRISHSGLFNRGNVNIYGDVRFHIPVSDYSKELDLKLGVQSFQILTWSVPSSRFTLGTYTSARYNHFGKRGYGSDLELYGAPYAQYRISPTVALSALYEMEFSHTFGAEPFDFVNDGTDFEPGVIWDITPTFMVNPYLNFYPNDKLAWETTSIGLIVSWRML